MDEKAVSRTPPEMAKRQEKQPETDISKTFANNGKATRGGKLRQIFPELLKEISFFDDVQYGQNLRLISEKLNISQQLLSKYMRRLTTEKLIERIQSWPFAVYKLTEKAKLINGKLVQSEKRLKTEWRYHNLVVKSRVIAWGTWKFGKIIPMCGGWGYQDVKVNNTTVRVQTNGLIRIVAPELIGENIEELQVRAAARAQDTLRALIDRYDMKVTTIASSREGSKELLHSEDLARFFGRIKTEDLYVDKSGDDDNLEEPESSHKIEDLLAMPVILRALDAKLAPAVNELSRMIELHLEVERGILAGLERHNDADRELTQAVREFRAVRGEAGTGDGLGALSNPMPSSVSSRSADGPEDGPRIEVEFTRPFGRFECAGKMIGPFGIGARIYLPDPTGLWLINNDFAERVA